MFSNLKYVGIIDYITFLGTILQACDTRYLKINNGIHTTLYHVLHFQNFITLKRVVKFYHFKGQSSPQTQMYNCYLIILI